MQRIENKYIPAIECGDVEVVKQLLANNVDPTVNKNEAFRHAAMNGQIEIVKILLNDNRVNPWDDNRMAFRLAFANRHKEVVTLLLAHNMTTKKVDGQFFNAYVQSDPAFFSGCFSTLFFKPRISLLFEQMQQNQDEMRHSPEM